MDRPCRKTQGQTDVPKSWSSGDKCNRGRPPSPWIDDMRRPAGNWIGKTQNRQYWTNLEEGIYPAIAEEKDYE